MEKISKKTHKALTNIKEHSDKHLWMRANEFAQKLWGEDPTKKDLFLAVTNQGNGACSGKKAWRAAGAYMGRLERMGYLISSELGYRITNRGTRAIEAYEHEKD